MGKKTDTYFLYNPIIRGREGQENVDIVLIAGKVPEDYQDIKGTKHHFDDHEVVREAMGI